MNTNKRILVVLFGLILSITSCSKKAAPVQDYLNTGKEIVFDNVKYNLVWSSHPSDNYYKQEYLSDKDTLEKFRKMILFDVITGNAKLRDVVEAKVAELKKMKESDPMVNFDIFEKNGEIMLDFLLSKNMPGTNEPDIVERNVYRYMPYNDSNGNQGVLLFGVSDRVYGDDISNFLTALKGNRFNLPNAVGAFVMPVTKIAK